MQRCFCSYRRGYAAKNAIRRDMKANKKECKCSKMQRVFVASSVKPLQQCGWYALPIGISFDLLVRKTSLSEARLLLLFFFLLIVLFFFKVFEDPWLFWFLLPQWSSQLRE